MRRSSPLSGIDADFHFFERPGEDWFSGDLDGYVDEAILVLYSDLDSHD